MLGEAWRVVRLEQSDGRDLSFILQAVEKKQVFVSEHSIDFRNESTERWSGGVGLGRGMALCEFLPLQSSRLPCCKP